MTEVEKFWALPVYERYRTETVTAETLGDLIPYWDEQLGPLKIGHTVRIRNPFPKTGMGTCDVIAAVDENGQKWRQGLGYREKFEGF